MKKYLLAAALLPLLGGCASIVSGTQQTVFVSTPPTSDANCKLSNDKGVWYLAQTPGSITVHRSYEALDVSCHKPGYGSGHQTVRSNTKALAFGNAVFGGVIGAGVDVANGSAYDYPQEITVPLRGKGE